MSAVARYLLIAGVLSGAVGTGIYINDIWISGDGVLQSPRGLTGTFIGIGLLLVAIGLRLVMRDELRRRGR